MKNLEIKMAGNPVLRLISEKLHDDSYGTEELNDLSEKLFYMMDIKNGIGLAAPQIGINKRAIVFGMEKHPVYIDIDPIPRTILFNPQYKAITNEVCEDYEGCLSFGTIRGKVSRYKQIYYCGFDANGNFIEKEVFGLHARVVQHEIDHLDGILFLDKITNHYSVGFHDELISAGILKTKKNN